MIDEVLYRREVERVRYYRNNFDAGVPRNLLATTKYLSESAMSVFLSPWECLSSNQAIAFTRELDAELSPEHPLYGITTRAVAHSCRADDALFGLNDGRVVVVHLTWGSAPERPPYPIHQIYDSLGDWTQQVMVVQHADE